MMHSGSPASVKNHVLDQFGDNSKCLRILIAMIAYGMGVNCKGVMRVIHFGPSKSIEVYMQLVAVGETESRVMLCYSTMVLMLRQQIQT